MREYEDSGQHDPRPPHRESATAGCVPEESKDNGGDHKKQRARKPRLEACVGRHGGHSKGCWVRGTTHRARRTGLGAPGRRTGLDSGAGRHVWT